MFRIRSTTPQVAPKPVVEQTAVDKFGFPDGRLPLGRDMWPFIENASPRYMLELLQAIDDKVLEYWEFGQVTAIVRRLLEIRYHDYSISDDLRMIFDSLANSMMRALDAYPDREHAKKIQAAWDHTINAGKMTGFGTVCGNLENYPNDPRVYAHAVRLDKVDQLTAFLDLGKDSVRIIVPRLVSALLQQALPGMNQGNVSLRQGAPLPLQNVPIGISWLLLIGNPTIRALLTPIQKKVFFNAVSRYDDARNFSLNLGLIKDNEQNDGFDLIRNSDRVSTLIAGFIGDNANDVVAYLRDATLRAERNLMWDSLPEHIQTSIRHWLLIIRGHIVAETLKNYGDNLHITKIMDKSMASLNKETRAIFDQDMDIVRIAFDRVKTGPFDQSPDSNIIPGFDVYMSTRLMDEVQALGKSEEDALTMLHFIMSLFRDQWLLAANKFRFMLRYSVDPEKLVREEDMLVPLN